MRRWRDASPETRKVITVNTTHRIAPWSDAVFALDLKWWQHEDNSDVYHFAGAKFSSSFSGRGVVKLQRPFEHHGNSGAAAVSLAYMFGAARIYLLGYDCQRTGGKAHWHGDHPKGLGNAGSMPIVTAHCARSHSCSAWLRPAARNARIASSTACGAWNIAAMTRPASPRSPTAISSAAAC